MERAAQRFHAIARAFFILLGTSLIVLAVFRTVAFFSSPSSTPAPTLAPSSSRTPADCTYARPCIGSTQMVNVPVGNRVCFDPPIWSNLEGFGMTVSSQGVPEHRYACSVEDVVNGSCKEKPIETFRFNPKDGVVPPRHWFTSDPGHLCSPK